MDRNKREEIKKMLLDMDRDRNIDLLGKKLSIFCQTHIAVGHGIQGGRLGPLRLRSAAAQIRDNFKGFPIVIY